MSRSDAVSRLLALLYAGLGSVVRFGLRGLGQCLAGRDRRELSQWSIVSVGAALTTAW